MYDVDKIRNDFPMIKECPKMQGHDLVFLDNASTSFKPYCVIDAIEEYYKHGTSNSHRGDYDLAVSTDNKIADARHEVATFIGAKDDEIVFTSGDSMALNLVAYGYACKFLKSGDEILITQAEHASNVLPWFRVAEMTGCTINYIPLNEEGRLIPENLKKTISSKTKIVAVAHVTNVLGYVIDIKEIAKITHEFGAILVCDGAQSVPHMSVDVTDLDVDFLAFSGHKMLGPTGVGVLYGKYDLLDMMDPLMSGGGMNAKFDMCGDVAYLKPPVRFEAGTLNIAGIIGLAEAVRYLKKVGMDNIEAHERKLRDYLVSKLEDNKDIIIYNKNAESGIVTFNKKGVFAQDEATYLNSKGIAIRSGQHCAKILITFLNEVATCRASLYLYTSKEDVDALVDALNNEEGDFLDAYFS